MHQILHIISLHFSFILAILDNYSLRIYILPFKTMNFRSLNEGQLQGSANFIKKQWKDFKKYSNSRLSILP